VPTWFGPAAFLGYLWMRRLYGQERTMQEFLASTDVRARATAAAPPAPRPGLCPPELALRQPETIYVVAVTDKVPDRLHT
jgi:hypothetical protein